MVIEHLEREIAKAIGVGVGRMRSVSGGDINDAFEAILTDGRKAFVKTARGAAHPEMFAREADGLKWLDEARVIRIPEVWGVGSRFLVLEWIEPGRPGRDYDAELGRQLAALHRAGAGSFGWTVDNFIGKLPQDNATEPDWPTFYRQRRLEPQVRMAIDRRHMNAAIGAKFEKLFAVLEDRVGPAEAPSRVHGDLWGGNRHVTPDGQPALIDPAPYGGHREMDLAMMQLFGGFGARVFEAYDETFPLADGWRQRVSLYQLYPLLTHVNLFGGSYVGSVQRALAELI